MKTSRPVLWIVRGAIPTVLAFGGLLAFAPLDYKAPQPQFFFCLLLLTVFWIGFVTLLTAFLCWIAGKISGGC